MFILSDVHGRAEGLKDFLNSNDENCIQLGDFGFIWTKWDIPYNKFLNKFEKEYPNKRIFTVLGNHENYDAIHSLPRVEVFGAKGYQIRSNVFAIDRGEILSIEGFTFLCVGGADSTDKNIRLYDQDYTGKKSWWAQEQITQKDIDNALENIEKYNGKVDVVCTHAEPTSFLKEYFRFGIDYPSEILLQDLFSQIDFTLWVCGHIHETVHGEIHDKTIISLGINEFIIID